MTAPSRTIRHLFPAEVETLVGWAASEGWNPGLDDAAAFRAADPDGFLGAFVEGEMAAGISAVAYGADYGFIGLYICRHDRRGQGHGKAVWNAGMARLGDRTIGLDGVPDQQANYRSMGFAAVYRTTRFSGRPHLAASPGEGVQTVTADLVPLIVDYDRRCFPAPRLAFLEQWLRPPRTTMAIVRGGRIEGYGVARRCREGLKIGPLFADAPEGAAALAAALLAAVPDAGDIHIDVPETAGGFAELLASAGLAPGFETARMYRGPAPAVAQGRIFGITTLELG